MKRPDLDRVLSELELPEVEPSGDFVERTWDDLVPILTAPTSASSHPAGADVGAEVISLEDRPVGPDRRPRLAPRVVVAAAALVALVVGSWTLLDDRPQRIESAVPLLAPEASCEVLAADLDELLDGEVLSIEAVAALETAELEGVAAAIGRFNQRTDLAGLDVEARYMRVFERGLALAVRYRSAGDDGQANHAIDRALANLDDDNTWHATGPLDACFRIDD